ncbi:LppU/SCO3897 family protein [Streptomyces sp. HUCO-GS316]|uniref:LppU/SCO3897 family protein n=1 Tax=Streptomyces sp. HUCO-GS316 TaxID=2692198 RepID=UPI00301B82D0
MTTPPPQGQNPFAQGQQPAGQPQGQAPYPPQPGFPQPGMAPVPPQQPSRRPKFKTIKNVIIVAAVAVAAVVGYIASQDDADHANVGDCLKSASSSSDRMEVVDCKSSDAEAKVLKKIKGHYTQFTAESECRKVDDATSFYAETGDGEEFLLCLSDV